MKRISLSKQAQPETRLFHNFDKKFIIKIPNSLSNKSSLLQTDLANSTQRTFMLASTSKIHLSSTKQMNNLTLDNSTGRNSQKQIKSILSKRQFTSRNYTVNKLRKYTFRKKTAPNDTSTSFQFSSQSFDQFCHLKIFSDNSSPQELFSIKVKPSSTTNLQELLKNKLKNQQIVGFKTQPQNILLDLYLTLDYSNLSFLNGTLLQLSPIQKIPCPQVDISSFDIYNCIGVGGFSKVFLCRFKEDGQFYAMKLIDKRLILKHKKNKIVMNERNIMESISHPFLIKMKFAFETADNLAFVLQYCPGGEIFSIVKKCKRMPEETARFYMIEILLGLEYLHQEGIIYRDFKPQNILVGIDGHIKIADFGLAKPNYFSSDDRAYSFCGSPEYMPPEMIMRKGHSLAVDFYCLGAVLYEFVTGLPPFYNNDTNQIYEGTLNEPVCFPARCNISSDLKSLLKGLLCKEQNRRLGSLDGVMQVLGHRWFGKFQRQKYLRKQVTPPFSFKQISSIKIDPEELRSQKEIYLKEAISQQQPGKINFQYAFDHFHYDHRFLTYELQNASSTALFRRKDSIPKKISSKISKQSLALLKKIKSIKQIRQNSPQE